MQFDFDRVLSRRHTNSIKWDFVSSDGQLVPRPLDEGSSSEKTIIPLGLSDMDFPTAPSIIKALQGAVAHGVFGYTRPDSSYYQAICQWMAKRHHWSVEADWIATTSGTMQTITLAIQTLTKPGDGIIIQPPLFGPIGQAIVDNNRQIISNPLLLSSGRYLMDFEDLEAKAALPNSRMLILCHPHNPVGRVWTPDEIRQLGAICRRHDLVLVTDEIHGELCYSWTTFAPVGKIDSALNERLVACTGPSKAFNLPGLRTSLAIIPNVSLRERFKIGQRNLNELFSHNLMGMLALQEAYKNGESWLDAMLAYIEGNYLFLQSTLSNEFPQLQLIPAEGLYLAWIDCRSLSNDETVLKRLFREKARVELEWGSNFGEQGRGYVRLNLACPRATLEQGLERMKRVIS